MPEMSKKNVNRGKKLAISFYTKEKMTCSVCSKPFPREEMLSGKGRMIAGDLTDELHRIFEPSVKYGQVYPLIYSVGACPNCHTALLWSDFKSLSSAEAAELLERDEERKRAVSTIFPHYNLNRERTIFDGAAMYYLSLLTYEHMPKIYSPTLKKGIVSLRLAWLCGYLHKLMPDRNYDYIQQVFYRKAMFFYPLALEYEARGMEIIADVGNFGPDIDKNYGYDGVIYLSGLLEYKYGQREDIPARLKKLDEKKRAIARLFGLGRASKEKPGPLLEHSRNLYENMTRELKDASEIDFLDDEDEE